MATSKTKTDDKTSDKKKNRLLIEQKLKEAFSGLAYVVGDKKFERRMHKAGKMLTDSFSKKDLNNFRKITEPAHSAAEKPDDTTLLIEELP